MSGQHTPGPWHYEPCMFGHANNRKNPIVESETHGAGHYIARLFSQASTIPGLISLAPSSAEAEANAKLIAAAPDLLAALKGICTEEPPPDEAWKAAEAAIETAE